MYYLLEATLNWQFIIKIVILKVRNIGLHIHLSSSKVVNDASEELWDGLLPFMHVHDKVVDAWL